MAIAPCLHCIQIFLSRERREEGERESGGRGDGNGEGKDEAIVYPTLSFFFSFSFERRQRNSSNVHDRHLVHYRVFTNPRNKEAPAIVTGAIDENFVTNAEGIASTMFLFSQRIFSSLDSAGVSFFPGIRQNCKIV